MTLTDDQSSEYSGLLVELGDNRDADLWMNFISDHSAPNATKKVLDLGCGAGGMFFPLHRAGYSVTGVDTNNDSISHIRKKLNAEANSSVVQADFCKDQLGELESFDAALLRSVMLNYPEVVENITPNVSRHLKKSGIWIAEVYDTRFLKLGRTYDDTYQYSEVVMSPEGMQVRVTYKDINKSVAAVVRPVKTDEVIKLSSGKLECVADIAVNDYINAYIFRRS